MGEHAEDILNGDVDEQTGEWLGNGQGYPRTMVRSFNPVFGVQNFLKKRGIVDEVEYHNLVRSFNELPPEGTKMKYKELTALCNNIQVNFSKFIAHTAKHLAQKKKL